MGHVDEVEFVTRTRMTVFVPLPPLMMHSSACPNDGQQTHRPYIQSCWVDSEQRTLLAFIHH